MAGKARIVESSRPSATSMPVPDKMLELDGNESFVELPPHVFDGLTEATVEGWVKWDKFQTHSRFFDINVRAGWWHLRNVGVRPALNMSLVGTDGGERIICPRIVPIGEWIHLAATITADSRRLYVNGALVGERTENGDAPELCAVERAVVGRRWREAVRTQEPGVDWRAVVG